MKKLITLAVLVAVSSSAAFASMSRTNALGVPNWMIEDDDTLIWSNPARITEYTNIIWAELATVAPGTHWGGLSNRLDLFDFAAFAGRPYAGNLGNATVDASGDAAGDGFVMPPGTVNAMDQSTPIGKFDLMLARVMDDMTVGARITFSSARDDYMDDTESVTAAVGDDASIENFSNSDIEIALGMRKNDVALFSVLDAALQINLLNVDNIIEFQEYVAGAVNARRVAQLRSFSLDNGLNLALTGRGVIPMGDSRLVTLVGLSLEDISAKYDHKQNSNTAADNTFDISYLNSTENKTTEIVLGGAFNRNISERALMIAGASVELTNNSVKEKTEDRNPAGASGTAIERSETTNTLVVPVNLALEYTFSDRIVSRIGISREIINRTVTKTTEQDIVLGVTYDNEGETITETTVDNVAAAAAVNVVSFGLGLQVADNLTIDAVVDQQILFTGGWLTSGNAIDPNVQVTATLRY